MRISKTLVAVVAVAGLVFFGATSPADAAAKKKAWNGKTCTIVGTARNDRIKGTARADVICGLGGNDTITGLGGNDIIDGGAGNDTIDAGVGNDIVMGGLGNDKLVGGTGNDTLDGSAGNDSLSGSAGDDNLMGGAGNDAVNGGAGSDTASFADVTDPSQNLSINLAAGSASGDGADSLAATENATSGAGNDTLIGDGVANVLNGGAGDDTMIGGAGNDKLDGATGSDNLDGGAGVNPCRGNGTSFDAGDVFDIMSCEDVTGPKVVSVVTTPDHLDTRSAAQQYKVVVRVRDDLSGFNYCSNAGMNYSAGGSVWAYLHTPYSYTGGPNTSQSNSPMVVGTPAVPGTTSPSCNYLPVGADSSNLPVVNEFTDDGRLLDVTYTFIGSLPRFSRFGAWEVNVSGSDRTSNMISDMMSVVVNYPGGGSWTNQVQRTYPGFINYQ